MISYSIRYDYVMCGRQFLVNYLTEVNQIRYGTSILVDADVHYAKSRTDHVVPPNGRTFTSVISYNSRYDYVMCGR